MLANVLREHGSLLQTLRGNNNLTWVLFGC
jgi:hypothetical protein